MADLSPVSQSILAAIERCITASPAPPTTGDIAAAALRAAADQIISGVPPPCADFDEYAKGFLAAHVKYRRDLLAIAAELEGATRDPLEPNDLSHLSDAEFQALAPQGYHGV